jgi:hypothetical protein
MTKYKNYIKIVYAYIYIYIYVIIISLPQLTPNDLLLVARQHLKALPKDIPPSFSLWGRIKEN